MYNIEDYIGVFDKSVPNETVQTQKLKSIQGHLYKYYSLDSDYTLGNIENDILYFSKPEKFNDPFDCNWGFDEDTLISDILIAAVVTCPLKSFFGECNTLCKMILNELCSNDELLQLKKVFDEIFSTNLCIHDLIDCDIKNKAKILLPYITSDNYENLDEFFSSCAEMTTYQNKLNVAINIAYGVTCFSERYDIALMWSHYANKHTGICVEYDFSKLEVNNRLLVQLFPVIYTKARQCFPNGVSYDENEKFVMSTAPFSTHQIIKNLISKSDVWSYEKEWRLIGFLRELKDQKLQLPIISKIYLGVNISTKNRDKVIQLAKNKNIPIFQLYLSNSKYELKIKQIL